MTVLSYLDITTAHLTAAEMAAVSGNFAELDELTPRVIVHDYGAWVNVPDLDTAPDGDDAVAERYPNVGACLKRARELGCSWINFDRDARHDDVLPIYEW